MQKLCSYALKGSSVRDGAVHSSLKLACLQLSILNLFSL